MGRTNEDLRIKEQTIFCIEEWPLRNARKLRSKFKGEKSKKREDSKKRDAETQLAAENQKRAKLQGLVKAHAAPTNQREVMPNSALVSEAHLPLDASRPRVTTNQDSQIESQASTTQRLSAVVVQASTGSRSKSPESVDQLAPTVSSILHLASMSKDVVPRCDERSRAEDTQDWTGIEFGLESEEEMEDISEIHQDAEYDLGIHQADADLQETSPDIESRDCNSTTENATMSPKDRSNGSNLIIPDPVVDVDQSIKVILESSNIGSTLRSSVTASPPSPDTILTNNPTKPQTPSIDDVERGLVRGEEKIKEFVMKECMPFIVYSRTKKKTSPRDELRELFLTCRKLPFRIVKGRLLVELRNRIRAPGQKTAIPSTADLFNPNDILNALQSIKMTTINAKTNRAYGQMRLFKSVQGKIKCPGYVPDTALTHGVAAHRSILAQMVRRAAPNLSEEELSDKKNSAIYEYEAGQKWVHVGEWFGGEGIILVFVTAGIASSVVTKDWSVFQRECVQVISEYLPSITGLVELLGEAALDNYCRHGLLDQDTVDAVAAFEGYRPPVTETEEDGSGDEDGTSVAYETRV